MYKYIAVALFVLFLTLPSFARPVNEVYGGVSNGQMIYYSFKTNKWYYQRPKHKAKHILDVVRYETRTPEAYSEYVSLKGHVYAPAGSNYEFLYKGRLITYHIFDDKFYEIIYHKENKAFIEIPMDEEEIKKLMGNPKIIHISDFDNEHKLTVTKLPLKKQYYLILNDTEKYFYRYSINTSTKDRMIRTLFFVKKPTTLIYSHYVEDRDDFPPYEDRKSVV